LGNDVEPKPVYNDKQIAILRNLRNNPALIELLFKTKNKNRVDVFAEIDVLIQASKAEEKLMLIDLKKKMIRGDFALGMACEYFKKSQAVWNLINQEKPLRKNCDSIR
jgi:hypothetical protein